MSATASASASPSAAGAAHPYKLRAKGPFPEYDAGVRRVPVDATARRKAKKRDPMEKLRSSWSKFAVDVRTPASEVTAAGATINGYPVNAAQVAFLAESFGVRMRDGGHYWYDRESGFFGKVGGISRHHLDPRLRIAGDLDARSSAGDTGIFVNGREIAAEEARNWERAGMVLGGGDPPPPPSSGYRYRVDPLGRVYDDATGSLLFNWRQKYRSMQNRHLAIGAGVVGVALLGGLGAEGLFGAGGEEAMFGGDLGGGGGGDLGGGGGAWGGDAGGGTGTADIYASDATGAASNFNSSGEGYVMFDDGSSVSFA